jgi:hypothetical protein
MRLRIAALAGPVSERSSLLARMTHREVQRPQPFFDLAQRVGNQAITRLVGQARLQAKLTINAPGDTFEREADRVADSVMRMRDPAAASGVSEAHPAVQRCACGGTAPPVVHQVLSSSGESLDGDARSFMEPRLGVDLGGVRIHRDGLAAASARAVSALAYTVGNHVVFGAGRYAPGTGEGRRLLAHELTHVIQQGGGRSAGLLQRAEVDDRSCAGLTDIESDVDTHVNSEIAAARVAAGKPIPVMAFMRDVESRLGAGPVSPIESFIENLSASKRILPPQSLAGTKYQGVASVNRFYHLQTLGMAHVVGSAAKIHGICVGADKLGHFFEEGLIYFQIATARGGTTAAAKSAGRWLEIGIQGLSATGVYSNADQAANLAGMRFWKDLRANPSGFKFRIKDYITTRWNEQVNPSFYSASEGGVIWNNLLTGPWKGTFTSGGAGTTPIGITVTLSATSAGVSGTYEWPPGAKSPNKGTISSGVITQQTTSVTGTEPGGGTSSDTPVSGVSIAFDWAGASSSGKGTWTTTDEQTLDGTWGIGTSRTSGGTWKMMKT